MTEEERKALSEVLAEPEFGKTLADAVREGVKLHLKNQVTQLAGHANLEIKPVVYDPYRTTFVFLKGLIAFCLALIVGIVNALPDNAATFFSLTYRMLGGVLAWMAITALIATLCAAVAQGYKHYYFDAKQNNETPKPVTKPRLVLLMGLPILTGLMAVGFCVAAGIAMLNNNAWPAGLKSALCLLWPL